MTTPAERRALTFVVALALLGLAVRTWRTDIARRPATPAELAALDRQISAVDSARAATGARRKTERTTAANRDTGGAQRSRGRGRGDAATTRAAAGLPAPTNADQPLARYELRRLAVERSNADARNRLMALHPPVRAAPDPEPGRRSSAETGAAGAAGSGGARRLDVDRATAAELEGLPGIGPSLAARIVSDRAAGGPFGSLAGLQRVRGVGPALATRIAPFVMFSGPRQAPSPPSRKVKSQPRRRLP